MCQGPSGSRENRFFIFFHRTRHLFVDLGVYVDTQTISRPINECLLNVDWDAKEPGRHTPPPTLEQDGELWGQEWTVLPSLCNSNSLSECPSGSRFSSSFQVIPCGSSAGPPLGGCLGGTSMDGSTTASPI